MIFFLPIFYKYDPAIGEKINPATSKILKKHIILYINYLIIKPVAVRFIS